MFSQSDGIPENSEFFCPDPHSTSSHPYSGIISCSPEESRPADRAAVMNGRPVVPDEYFTSSPGSQLIVLELVQEVELCRPCLTCHAAVNSSCILPQVDLSCAQNTGKLLGRNQDQQQSDGSVHALTKCVYLLIEAFILFGYAHTEDCS